MLTKQETSNKLAYLTKQDRETSALLKVQANSLEAQCRGILDRN